MDEQRTYPNVRYGVAVMRPESLMRIETYTPPPPTDAEQFAAVAKTTGHALAVILGAVVAIVAGSLGLFYVGAASLAGLYGIAVGLVAFMVWDMRRGRRY